jgi:hypothetical protein
VTFLVGIALGATVALVGAFLVHVSSHPGDPLGHLRMSERWLSDWHRKDHRG